MSTKESWSCNRLVQSETFEEMPQVIDEQDISGEFIDEEEGNEV